MASAFMNPLIEAEPYELAAAGNVSDSKTASPDELQAFYSNMERQESLQRRLSRDKKRSVWSRKPSKRGAMATPATIALEKFPKPRTSSPPRPRSLKATEDEAERMDELKEKSDPASSNVQRSIIPDPLGELPAWFNKEKTDWVAAPLPSHRMRYQIHNPVGPRWYKNHHLIPPSQRDIGMRPPTLFSPSFPPMSSQEPAEPVPTRTTSGSSGSHDTSQPGVKDGQPRTRKTSQTAVDMMDVTDPWGGNFRHPSPYDLRTGSSRPPPEPVQSHLSAQSGQSGQSGQNGQSGQSGQSGQNGQIAQNGNTGQSRHRTVTPSPLSQSTSVVHLQPREATVPERKSSKRRRRVSDLFGIKSRPDLSVRGLFPSHSHKRHSDMPSRPTANASLISFQTNGEKKNRGSILLRIARKLTIIRKPDLTRSEGNVEQEDWHHISGDNSTTSNGGTQGSYNRLSSPVVGDGDNKVNPEESRRAQQAEDKRSVASVSLIETPFPMGKLTVANPDSTSSLGDTPVQRDIPLPPEPDHQSKSPVPESRRPDPSFQEPMQRSSSSQERHNHSQTATKFPVLTSYSSNAHPDQEISFPSYDKTSAQPVASEAVPGPSMQQSSQRLTPPTAYRGQGPVGRQGAGLPIQTPLSVHDPSIADMVQATAAYVEDPSLWRLSILANPPTPHSEGELPLVSSPVLSTLENFPTPLPPAGSSGFQPRLSAEGKKSRNPSPAKATRDEGHGNVQTEVFRLVRNPSGAVGQAGQSIVAAGEQWDVVESTGNNPRRSKTRERDRSSRTMEQENGHHRDSRRQERSKTDPDHRSHRNSSEPPKHAPNGVANHHPGYHRTHSYDATGMSPSVADSKPSRLSSEAREDKRNKLTVPINFNKPTPPSPPPSPQPSDGPSTPIRRQSTSARPVSELPSSAELNAVRARDAWEINRMYRGRSMHYGAEPNGILSSPTPLVATIPPLNGPTSQDAAAPHGSGHTSYMVQDTFQGRDHVNAHQSYDYMPPPPILFSPGASAQPSPQMTAYYSTHSSQMPSSPAQPYPHNLNGMGSSMSIGSIDTLHSDLPVRPSLANPLPEPPRESPYLSSPLQPVQSSERNGDARISDYRTRYNGVTAAHF